MGNLITSFVSGFASAFSKLFGSPLDFLSGKSCSSVCGSTWDFMCYIENFCVANLLKMAMVLVLLYLVLLFFYVMHKLGICGCVCQGLCRMIWACFSSYFYALECCCSFICVKLRRLKRIRRHHMRRDIEAEFDTSEGECFNSHYSYYAPRHVEMSTSSMISRRRRHRRSSRRLNKPLKPRRRRIRVGIARNNVNGDRRKSVKHRKHVSSFRDIRVTQTSNSIDEKQKYGKVCRRRS